MSPSTASRALDDSKQPSRSANARRIREIASELGYRPNPAASSLRRKRTRTVGVLVPRLTDVVMAMFYEEIASACLRHGYHPLVATTRDDPETSHKAAETLLARHVDGLILTTARSHGDDQPAELARRGVPYMLALRTDGHGPAAVGDDKLGGYLATRHLLDLGHERIGLVAGPEYASNSRGRKDGYCRALREAQVPATPELVKWASFSMEAGEQAGGSLLAIRPRPTAIFALNDYTAIGVMAVAHSMGLRVPDDLSVVGYNDIPLAARMPVTLTSIRVPFRELADYAVTQLLYAIDSRSTETRSFAPTLIPRNSSIRVG